MWLATVLVLSDELAGDLVIAFAARQPAEDLQFAWGQGGADRAGGVVRGRGDRDVSLADTLQQLSGDLGGEHRSPAAVASTAAMIVSGAAVFRM